MNVKRTSKQQYALGYNIGQWAKKNNLIVEKEYRFDKVRLWRADFAIPGIKVLIEWEGIMSTKSRHTTLKGFSGDCNKYNSAQLDGWKVLRYTILNYGNVVDDLNKANILTNDNEN